MPKTSCALIGPGEGPLVRTNGPGMVKVRGLQEGEQARLALLGGQAMAEVTLKNGAQSFPSADFVKVSYEGKFKGFIALVEMGA